jgi:hypothetical protein
MGEVLNKNLRHNDSNVGVVLSAMQKQDEREESIEANFII